ncbi:hypothetical protein BD769DRAFT_1386509 [Suillus cothurnatus]|nr:hypothetical protein BD769DRAFT_1386509 [Suillus cothurnatus]
MPTYPEMFHVVRALQCASTELTIFSCELGETVTIAYPVNWATAWECFCGLLTEYCTPVHFETNCHGHAMAYCHQSPSICGFSSTPSGHTDLFPYFEGYCGTPSSALTLSQQGGTVCNVAYYHHQVPAVNMCQQRITPYLRRQPAPLVNEVTSLSPTEQKVLRSLADGNGITKYEHIGLLELCGGCQRMFAASALRTHILTCPQS